MSRKLQLCLYCPTLCLSRCPVSLATGNITFSPWGKASSAWRLNKGLVPLDRDTILPTYMCHDCLSCREACNHDQDVPSMLAETRMELAASGHGLVSPRTDTFDMEESWRLLRDTAPSWRRVEDCQALLVPGRELLNKDGIKILQAIFRVLDLVDDKVVGVNRDSVLECGHHPYAHADMEGTTREANRAFNRYGRYSRVVLGSPHCASFMRLKWPEMGMDRSRQAVTILEFVGKKVDFSNPGFYPKRVAYHDPCHLGRHLGLYQVARDLLKWATNHPPVELAYSRNRAFCCGGGYPVDTVAPEAANRVTDMLVELFESSGADVLATSCGRCKQRLKGARKGLKVFHLMEIIGKAKK